MIFTLFCFANLVFEKPHSHHQGLKILPDNMIIKIPQKKKEDLKGSKLGFSVTHLILAQEWLI